MRSYTVIRSQMLSLRDRYDPEWDIAKDDPTVTYADEQLIEVVDWLIDRVEHLENMIVLLMAETGDDNGYE